MVAILRYIIIYNTSSLINTIQLSCLTALVPSPDWFIGLDSLDLCREGEWVDHARLDVSPMDAGTDNGLTFTSPNWATQPREEVTIITNTSPSHPASSFFYPHLSSLPTIASYSLHKVNYLPLWCQISCFSLFQAA